MPATLIPIREFVEVLKDAFSRPRTPDEMLEIINAHPVDPASLEPYREFRSEKYTRSLVYKCECFEVLVLCWEVGQISAIHNHADQLCWMACPEGRLQVVNYAVKEGNERGGHCVIEPTTDFWLTPDGAGAVDPEEPIHSVGNPRVEGVEPQRAISVHIYSHPYDRCMIYKPEAQQALEVGLCYDSQPELA